MMSSPKHTRKKGALIQSQRLLEPEDEALWHAVTKKVKPLGLKPSKNHTGAEKEPYAHKHIGQNHRLDPTLLLQSAARSDKQDYRHGKAPGLDRKTQLRMRRGQVKVEGRLDLHGMIQTEAHRALLNFIESAYYSGRRSVLVITGKGLTKEGEVGVLRQAVPRWLNEPPLSVWIKGFDYAARSHGGEGALYVLIRRKR
jgi:DNA-nicking Smr family endonuclease